MLKLTPINIIVKVSSSLMLLIDNVRIYIIITAHLLGVAMYCGVEQLGSSPGS